MEWLKHIRILMILAPGMFLALAGCARAPVNKTLQAEEALIGAGFQLKMADTPAKVERISGKKRRSNAPTGIRINMKIRCSRVMVGGDSLFYSNIENPVLYAGFFTSYLPFDNKQTSNNAEIRTRRRNIGIKAFLSSSYRQT